MLNRRTSVGALGIGLSTGFAGVVGAGPFAARAQAAYPKRPVTLMVPWPAGAPSDEVARRLQPAFQQALGQPVIVENVGGAGGSLGVARVMQQPADGHTILVGTPTELVLSPLTIPAVRFKAEDFALLASFGRVAYVLCCRVDLPHKRLADVVVQKGQRGNPLSIGNVGPGSLIQIMSLDFEKTSGLKLTHVPYRGLPPMVQDVMGGQLDLGFLPLAGHTMTTLEQGKLRALGVNTMRPSPLFPRLPTLAAGHRAFGRFDYEVWGGLLVRRETPAEVQQRLLQVWTGVTRDGDFVSWARSTGSDPLPVMPLAEAQAFYPREVARYSALLRAFPEAMRN